MTRPPAPGFKAIRGRFEEFVALGAYVALGVLQGIALARYGELVQWGRPAV
jgi:hypothetical protein